MRDRIRSNTYAYNEIVVKELRYARLHLFTEYLRSQSDIHTVHPNTVLMPASILYPLNSYVHCNYRYHSSFVLLPRTNRYSTINVCYSCFSTLRKTVIKTFRKLKHLKVIIQTTCSRHVYYIMFLFF